MCCRSRRLRSRRWGPLKSTILPGAYRALRSRSIRMERKPIRRAVERGPRDRIGAGIGSPDRSDGARTRERGRRPPTRQQALCGSPEVHLGSSFEIYRRAPVRLADVQRLIKELAARHPRAARPTSHDPPCLNNSFHPPLALQDVRDAWWLIL